MARLIDADALSEHIKGLPTWFEDGGGMWSCLDGYPKGLFYPEDIISSIENAPTVDAVEVVHGWWKEPYRLFVECSECGTGYVKYDFIERANYCPNCGAKMDGERKDND